MTTAHRKGHAFVVAAPSGTGKTTVCRAVVDRDPQITVSISHTTRNPRAGEVEGEHYHFVTTAEFLDMVKAHEFLEHAEYGGNNYGTSHEALRVPMEEKGLDVLLEIEVQGAAQIREQETGAHFIFLLPPDMQSLEARLRGRGTDDDETIARRLGIADREIAAIEHFDYAVVNNDLAETIEAVREIIEAQRSGAPKALADAQGRFGRAEVFGRWRAAHPDAVSAPLSAD